MLHLLQLPQGTRVFKIIKRTLWFSNVHYTAHISGKGREKGSNQRGFQRTCFGFPEDIWDIHGIYETFGLHKIYGIMGFHKMYGNLGFHRI